MFICFIEISVLEGVKNMKISNVMFRPTASVFKNSKSPSYACGMTNIANNLKCDTVSFGNYDKSVTCTRTYNPAKEAAEEEKFRQSLLDHYFSKVLDESGGTILCRDGQPLTALDSGVVDELDRAVFSFDLPLSGGNFEGSIKQALAYCMRDDERLPDRYCDVLHGTSKENVGNILKYGPDFKKVKNTAFGPGMYFALCEADAQDYSPAKLKADVVKTTRSDGSTGRFVRINDCFYGKIQNAQVYNKLKNILGIEADNSDYDPYTPAYISAVKSEIPTRVLDDYCRNVIVNDLGVDAAYACAPYHHSCIVVFNPESITNLSDYSPSFEDKSDGGFRIFPLW